MGFVYRINKYIPDLLCAYKLKKFLKQDLLIEQQRLYIYIYIYI